MVSALTRAAHQLSPMTGLLRADALCHAGEWPSRSKRWAPSIGSPAGKASSALDTCRPKAAPLLLCMRLLDCRERQRCTWCRPTPSHLLCAPLCPRPMPCAAGHERGQVLGVTSGFVVPLVGLMHCDTLQIFTRGLRGGRCARAGGSGGGVP